MRFITSPTEALLQNLLLDLLTQNNVSFPRGEGDKLLNYTQPSTEWVSQWLLVPRKPLEAMLYF